MKVSWIAVSGFVSLLAGCERSPYDGFKAVNEQVHFKLRALGDGERLPTDSDSVLVRLRMARHGEAPGSLFSTEQWYGAIDELLPKGVAQAVRLHEGDSVSMVATAERIPWSAIGAEQGALLDSGRVDLEFSLFALRSREDSRHQAEVARMARTAADEDSTLARFFRSDRDPWQRYMGIYFRPDPKNPKGEAIVSGQTVTIAYVARFLDSGRTFDDTHASHQPLTFRLGDPDQVIKGLEIAVHLLPNGGKGRFVFPSALAFGQAGSSSRIVPPWTPVLYEVEVVDASKVTAPVLLMDSSDARR